MEHESVPVYIFSRSSGNSLDAAQAKVTVEVIENRE